MAFDKNPEEQRPGTLYIVATPIGNLEDISLRAIRILKEVDLIAAEDTRRTKKLLNAYEIVTPVISLFEHNELKKSGAVVEKIMQGSDVAYVSDAGTPGISDPGYLLIQEALSKKIPLVPIPGACAAITALSISGLPMDKFVYYGFLPVKPMKRRHLLKSLTNEAKTMIFYESPKRLTTSLRDLADLLGDRRIVVTRELTKIYEEHMRGSITEVMEALKDRVIKGEITLVIAGKKGEDRSYNEADIDHLFSLYQDETLSKKDMVERIANELGAPRNLVYRKVMKMSS